jgi:hypothetical protein
MAVMRAGSAAVPESVTASPDFQFIEWQGKRSSNWLPCAPRRRLKNDVPHPMDCSET